MNAVDALFLADRLSYNRAATLMSQIVEDAKAVAECLIPVEVSVLDPEVAQMSFVQYRYMPDLEKTALLADAFANECRGKVSAGKFVASRSRYSTDLVVRELWELRQLIDRHGIPYPFYVQEALQYWIGRKNRRVPRVRDLMDEKILNYVLKAWGTPAKRSCYPLDAIYWDPRFHFDDFTGDSPQTALLQLIDQRLEDARALGQHPAAALSDLLDSSISRASALHRYGSELVAKAIKLREEPDMLDEFLADI
jgi:hypothetical protein